MKYRKLTTKTFLSIVSDEAIEKLELSQSPIKPYTVEDVKHGKIGTKSIFKLTPAKSQYLERLNQRFFAHIEINNSAVAYVNKKSYLDMFEPHRGNANFLRLDIKSFFHSIDRDILKKTFVAYVSDDTFYENGKSKQSLIDAFLNLISLNVTNEYDDKQLLNKSILPIGFKSSPVISNIVFRKFDILIQELCSKSGISYTRYADDMLFSSPYEYNYLHTNNFLTEISYILSLGGFKINSSKTIKDKNMISINGYVIDSKGNGKSGSIRISEKKTKKIYKLIYMMEKGVSYKIIMNRIFKVKDRDIVYNFKKGKEEFKKKFYKTQIRNRLTGYRAYIISILKFNDKYQCIEEEYVSEYQTIVSSLEKQIYKLI